METIVGPHQGDSPAPGTDAGRWTERQRRWREEFGQNWSCMALNDGATVEHVRFATPASFQHGPCTQSLIANAVTPLSTPSPEKQRKAAVGSRGPGAVPQSLAHVRGADHGHVGQADYRTRRIRRDTGQLRRVGIAMEPDPVVSHHRSEQTGGRCPAWIHGCRGGCRQWWTVINSRRRPRRRSTKRVLPNYSLRCQS